MPLIKLSPAARWPVADLLLKKGFIVDNYSVSKPYIAFTGYYVSFVQEAKGNKVLYFNYTQHPELALIPKEAVEVFILDNSKEFL